MKKTLIASALMASLGASTIASAQEFDDRWYVNIMPGVVITDNDRDADNALGLRLGVGKHFSPNWSLDLEANYANPEQSANDLHWSQYGVGLTGRYHFVEDGRNWAPYLMAGAGIEWAREEFELIRNPASPARRKDSYPYGLFGGGVGVDYGRVGLRTELGYRIDIDDNSATRPNQDTFFDLFANVGLVIKFGPERQPTAPPTPPPAPPPAPVTTCADLDDDGDGVNNCDDRCPNTPAGTAVGPDGCPVPLTIDLRGVNFDFDKSTLRPDAITTLNEAIEILKKYPQLRVEVAGHTDSTGPENYNQGLSERRAKAVYDYLGQNGIDASRMVGPVGYGELRPIDSNDTREGRARNRRTELNVQN